MRLYILKLRTNEESGFSNFFAGVFDSLEKANLAGESIMTQYGKNFIGFYVTVAKLNEIY